MTVYEVGKLYHPNRTRWPSTAQYNYMAGEHHLHLFMPDPTPVEVEAARGGTYQFALVVDGPVICLLYQFQPLPWSDAVYSWHMVPAEQRREPPAEPYAEGTGAPLTIVLTDASTGIVRAIRVVGLGTNLTNALHAAIRGQAALPFRQVDYDAAIADLYRRYPQSSQLLPLAIARWPEPGPETRTPRGRPR